MGKDLNGKELGKGLSQRKDGRYSARVMYNGQRHVQYFNGLNEARRWLINTTYEVENDNKVIKPKMTLNQYFEYWIKNEKEGFVRKNTVLNYKARYKHNIKDEIGEMYIKDIKPFHCMQVLEKMDSQMYAPSTIHQVRATLHAIFQGAVEDEFIERNPVKSKVRGKPNKTKERRVLTVKEQKIFLDEAKDSPFYYEFALILQTGMRVGEVQGLRWTDINFKKKEIHVNRTAHFYPDEKEFTFDEPKSETSIRTIPVNEECMQLLKNLKRVRRSNNKVQNLISANLVFYDKFGLPIQTTKYNYELKKICNKCKITGLSMHCLRHTFATRCIEAGIRPKTLQILLGHSKISTTMDLYVHVSDDSLHQEILKLDLANGII